MSYQSIRQGHSKNESPVLFFEKKMAGKGYLSPCHNSASGRRPRAFGTRVRGDSDSLSSTYFSLFASLQIPFKTLSSLPFSISYTQLPPQFFFSHLICPCVIPTQKCENDLVWTATYTAGKFHHGWMGDFCTWFLLECSINNVTNKCPFSTFSSFSFQRYCHWQEATGKHSLGVCY